MPEELLHRPHVGAGLHEAGGEAVAERVRREPARAAGEPERWPSKKVKKEVPHKEVAIGVIWNGDRFYVQRRKEEGLLGGKRTERVIALLSFEAARARRFYRSATGSLDPRDRRSLLAAEVMRRIYSALLDEIERSSFDVFDRRIGLSRTRRAGVALRVLARTALAPW